MLQNTPERPPPPDDTAWVHVTVNDLSRAQLADAGITATVIYNTFDMDHGPGNRAAVRDAIGVSATARRA